MMLSKLKRVASYIATKYPVAHKWLLLVLVFLLATLTVSLLQGCATRVSTKDMQSALASAANLQAVIPPKAAEPCKGTELVSKEVAHDPDPAVREKAYAAFGILQTGQLGVCDDKRALAVESIELHNLYAARLSNDLRPLTFWERLFGRKKVK